MFVTLQLKAHVSKWPNLESRNLLWWLIAQGLLCALVLNLLYSAKRQKDAITPQSSHVHVHHDGWCKWSPSAVYSVSYCPMDTTWFPFDEQLCTLAYETWKYKTHEVNITLDTNNQVIEEYDPQPNVLWEFLGKYFLCKNAAISSKFRYYNITNSGLIHH